MTIVHFQIAPDTPPGEVTGHYLKESYTLIASPEAGIPPSMHRTSIDSLTLSVRPTDHVLVALDAYTNIERWEHRQLTLPPIDQESAVLCTDPFDEHGIGPGASAYVRYTFSHELSLLLIETAHGQVATRTRCLSCVVCGLGTDGELIELWIQGLRFGANLRPNQPLGLR